MNNLEKLLKEVFNSTSLSRAEKISKAENILLQKLKENPLDEDIYFKLAVIVLEEPEVDFIKSMEYMKTVLSFNANNAEAALFLSWIQYFHRGYTELDTINLLDTYIADNEQNSLTKSLCYLAKSWSDEISDVQKQCLLEKSIEVNNNYVSNYLSLANLYHLQENYKMEKSLITHALYNIIWIVSTDDSFNSKSFEAFQGRNFKGIIQVAIDDVPNYSHFKNEFLLETTMNSYRLNKLLAYLKAL